MIGKPGVGRPARRVGEVAKTRKVALAVGVALVLGGCATYTERPLTHAAVRAQLKPRPVTAVWVSRARLLLPQLPPITVHKGARMTPDLAAVIAVVGDPMLRSLRAEEAVASAQVLSAGLLPNPVFSYGLGVPISGAGLTRAFRVGLGLPIRSLITRRARVQAARAHARAVDLTIAWREWQVASRAKALTYELLVGRRARALLDHEVRALRASVATLDDAEASGFATIGAAAAARLALHQTKVARLAVREAYALKSQALRALLGIGSDVPLRLAWPRRAGGGMPERPVWLQGLGHRRLDLLALREGYRSADARLRAAIAGQFPAITVGVDRARDTSDINTLGGGVSVSLPIFNHNQGAIAQARASRRVLFRTYAARLFQARSEIETLLTKLRYTERTIRARRGTVRVLKRLQGLYRHALLRHRIAALTYYQLLDRADRERLALLRARAREDQLRVALEAASGRFEWPGTRHGG